MIIVARTEDDEYLFWGGTDWEDSPDYAEEYGSYEGSFEMGKLRVIYIDDGKTYNGTRIVSIYEI